MRPNKDFLNDLAAPRARFYLADLHVHSLGSADVCIGQRHDKLPQELRDRLPRLAKDPADSAAYDEKIAAKAPVVLFLAELVKRRDAVAADVGLSPGDDWAIVGITDHNVAQYAAHLSQHAWDTRKDHRLIVFPGIELDVTFPVPNSTCSPCAVHILCLYAPCTSASDIRIAVTAAAKTTWNFGQPLCLTDLAEFVRDLRMHPEYPCACIAAHVASHKGIQRETKKVILNNVTAEIARVEGALTGCDPAEERELKARLAQLTDQLKPDHGIDIQVLRVVGACGFDALQVADRTEERHYRRLHRFREHQGRAVPILASDAHTPWDVFCSDGRIPFVKLTAPSAETSATAFFRQLRDSALRFGETRTTWHTPGRVTHWIDGIEVTPDTKTASKFWSPSAAAGQPFVLPLSRNLNCLIGGRGSGKSAAIEAIAFLCSPDEYGIGATAKGKLLPDWYSRAAATLQGCTVRICWKTTSGTGFGVFSKRALFMSRYFDPSHNHRSVDHTDLDGRAVVSQGDRPPKIGVYRAHDIESAAQPERLRQLFDDLCGPEITELNKDIEQLRKALTEQRGQLVTTAKSIAELTQPEGPLRQYAIRKLQFDEVDKPDIRERYKQLDTAETAAGKTGALSEAFTQINAVRRLDDIEKDTKAFFTGGRSEVVDDKGNPLSGCGDVHTILKHTEDNADAEHRMLAALGVARELVRDFDGNLQGVHTNATTAAQAVREAMTKQGLPTGGKDRETKKLALAEAETDLQRYRQLTQEWEKAIATRKETHSRLVDRCKNRTELRKRTAEELTATLARDLDSSILVIVLDAQPIADCAEYFTWLEKFFEPAFARYKHNRSEAVVQRGILPATLRDFLLDPQVPVTTITIDAPKAEDGRIVEEDARAVREKCGGRTQCPLEWAGAEIPADVRAALPKDIADGVATFPADDKGVLRVDSVLKLDEVVLDDVPVIKLNDRPGDPQSTLRPVHELSPGQRCSAILPILLLSGGAPIVIDQPEENLDNRLIRQVIVNILSSMKLRRQVIVATHNPNLPVLGDCEQAVILRAVGKGESEVIANGDLESRPVIDFVTDIMEGGREAFQYRHCVYQDHWRGPVDAPETLVDPCIVVKESP